MQVNGQYFRTIWVYNAKSIFADVQVIDQRFLPHRFEVETLSTYKEMVTAISDMHVRGSGLIGVAGAFGVYLTIREAFTTGKNDEFIKRATDELMNTRPTAVNLKWGIEQMISKVMHLPANADRVRLALTSSQHIANLDAESCKRIGLNGLPIIEQIAVRKRGYTVNILTHCNAGWLAFTDYGSALSPIYLAHRKGIRVHVWVDETRPRNQGAALTAWELLNEGVPHTLIADNTGGHLMQNGMIDLVIVGADRIAVNGDFANKIGTYLKALAAFDNQIPFYVAAPTSTIDFNLYRGIGIPIEQRSANEVRYVSGLYNNKVVDVLICPRETPAINYAFDVTPARLVTGIITEKGIVNALSDEIAKLGGS